MVDEFCTTLGRFILVYAQTESVLKSLLASSANLSLQSSRALFSGTRARSAMDYVRRLYEAHGWNLVPKLKASFEQLATITDMRDKLLHQGFIHIGNGEFVTTNIATAHTEKTLKTYPVSVETLLEMTEDLQTIQTYMVFYTAEIHTPEWQESMVAAVQEPAPPWRYKSSSPEIGMGKTFQALQGKRRQHPPSQG